MGIEIIIFGIIIFVCIFMCIYTIATNKDLPDDDKKDETNWFNK